MIFNSTEFDVAITGDKLLFQPVDVKLPGELQETVVVRPTRHNATIARSSVPPIMKYTESGPVDEHEPIPFPLNSDANAIDDIEDWIKLEPKDIKNTEYVYLANPVCVISCKFKIPIYTSLKISHFKYLEHLPHDDQPTWIMPYNK